MPRVHGDVVSGVAAEWARTRGELVDGSATRAGAASERTGDERPAPIRENPEDAGSALVLGDSSPQLARALADAGFAVTRWSRHFGLGQKCSPWPPPGVFDEAWVRMTRSGQEAEMLLHAAAARVPEGAAVHLFGAGDEGIRSAARRFPSGTGRARPVLIKRRCRVLAATRTGPPTRRDGLDAWEVRAPVDWGTGPRDWLFHPGVFACGRLDPATRLLIETTVGLAGAGRRPRRVLDFGAGTGVIGAALMEAWGCEVVLLERDAIALAAAARNVPGATLVLGSRVRHAQGPFDLIVSNPPTHAGGARGTSGAETLEVVEEAASDAAKALAPGGALVMVAQARLGVGRVLERMLGRVETVATQPPFAVHVAPGGEGRR